MAMRHMASKGEYTGGKVTFGYTGKLEAVVRRGGGR
jgi:hypothetical protein